MDRAAQQRAPAPAIRGTTMSGRTSTLSALKYLDARRREILRPSRGSSKADGDITHLSDQSSHVT